MTIFFKTRITDVGEDAVELVEGGVLILFADGAPPELAEVSVLHKTEIQPLSEAPPVGATITLGEVSAKITAIGPMAWNKVREIGHVVINFNNATEADRPGEICASVIDGEILVKSLIFDNMITISA